MNIVAGAGLNITSNNGVQEVVLNTAITDIIVEAVDGYFLPAVYPDTSSRGSHGHRFAAG